MGNGGLARHPGAIWLTFQPLSFYVPHVGDLRPYTYFRPKNCVASHLLQLGRMSIRCVCHRVAPLLAVLASACADMEFEAGARPVHGHDSFAPQRPPTIPSKLLDYELHAPIVRKPARAQFAGPRRITQKVLLLTADEEQPSYLAARDALLRMGVPFQMVNAAEQEITDALLTDQQSTCHFSAVVFSTSGLGYLDPITGTWGSALSQDEWQRITNFQIECSAREAVWYAWPSADLGLAYVGTFSSDDTVPATIANPGFFKRVPGNATIAYQHAAGYRAAGIGGTMTKPIVTDSEGFMLLATYTRPDGTEVIVSMVDSNPYLLHALALEYDIIRWLTRGMFIGQKQTYLAPQIDDLFISNDMWRVDLHANPADSTTTFRITGSDLTNIATWQSSLQARLPAGSSFRTIMAYNGLGTTEGYSPDTSLLAVATNSGGTFEWLNHTWGHDNMDAMTRAEATSVITQNCDTGASLGLSGLSCDELVTPDISGLASAEVIQGMIDAGVRYVVSDTSRAASDPRFAANPGDNPSFNVGRDSPLDARVYQVPRHPTNVFYDVKDPTDMVDSYNTRFPGSASYAQILDLNTSWPLLYLLQGDLDPLMFHQPNLAAYDAAGHSLYGDFVDALVTKYVALSNAPVITLSQRAIGEAMKQRGALEGCNPSAVIVESSSGGRALELSSSAACTIPVTGLSAAQAGTVQIYAGDTITSVPMPPGGGTVSIPL